MTETNLSNTGAGKLRAFSERLNRLIDDREAVGADIRELMAEVKAEGFTPAVLRKVVAKQRKDQAKLAEEAALFELYEHAITGELFT